MRFLADAGISPKTVDFLRRSGDDAVYVREVAMQLGSFPASTP
jgi:predicted nuclease of predicted toxin-antitoxin system